MKKNLFFLHRWVSCLLFTLPSDLALLCTLTGRTFVLVESTSYWVTKGSSCQFLESKLVHFGQLITYETTIKPVFVIQKRAVRVITFSNFDQHSSPLFKALKIVKFPDLVTYLIAIYMYKFHNQLLPGVFASFFTKVDTVHSYNTRHSAKLTYYLPKARTNYGKFSIWFQGPKIWNAIDDETKKLSMSLFKKRLKQGFIEAY